MIDDVRGIIERGIHSLHDVLPEIRNLAVLQLKWEVVLLVVMLDLHLIVGLF